MAATGAGEDVIVGRAAGRSRATGSDAQDGSGAASLVGGSGVDLGFAAGRQVAQSSDADGVAGAESQRPVLTAHWTEEGSRQPAGQLDGSRLAGGVGSLVARTAGGWWRAAHPVTKWPLAVFGPLLLAVTVLAGPSVAWELLPLWVLGPLFLSAFVRTWLACAALASRAAAQRGAVAARGLQLYRYSSSGRLLGDAAAAAGIAREGLGRLAQEAGGRREALVVYAGSGQLAEDAKGGAARLAREQLARARAAAVRLWEDFIDWARPARRRTIKFLQKVF